MSTYFLSVPGLDIAGLREHDAAIGEWPEFSEAPVTTFMDFLLSRDEAYQAARQTLSDVDLLDLSEASEEQVAKLTGEQNAEREMRAQRRRDGGDAPAAKRTRGASSGGAASSSSAAAASGSGPGSGQAPKKRKPAELSAYERARDDQRAENEGKLRELGLA